ncbi:35835_t:CDS:2, partial [Racocetra persica]
MKKEEEEEEEEAFERNLKSANDISINKILDPTTKKRNSSNTLQNLIFILVIDPIRLGLGFLDVPTAQEIIAKNVHDVGPNEVERIRSYKQKVRPPWASDLQLS